MLYAVFHTAATQRENQGVQAMTEKPQDLTYTVPKRSILAGIALAAAALLALLALAGAV